MEPATLFTTCSLGIGCVLLMIANWPSITPWLARLSPRRGRDQRNPAELIDAYHVARDACEDDAQLAESTNQVFQALICRKVLRCEK